MSYDLPLTLPSPATASEESLTPLAEILEGLSRRRKALPAWLLYDERGSRLFESICELPEYYVTRAELEILRAHLAAIAEFIGPDASLIEPGAGCGLKARILLRALRRPRQYVPVEIDATALRRCVAAAQLCRPGLRVSALQVDFSQPFRVPEVDHVARRVLYFPGSTIGNFDPVAAQDLLAQFHGVVGSGGLLLIGFDLRKNAARLRRAYDDVSGLTAQFNLNLLAHLNRDYGANLDARHFLHRAVYDKVQHRIEMHLVSRCAQLFSVGGHSFRLNAGETIHTESSYKHRPSDFAWLASAAGWCREALWMDPQRRFAVMGLRAA